MYMKMLLNCTVWYEQLNWPKNVFIISLCILDIRTVTCDQ